MTNPTSIDQAAMNSGSTVGLTSKLPQGNHSKVVELTVPVGSKYLVRSYSISPQHAHLFEGLNPQDPKSVLDHHLALVELLEQGGAACISIRYDKQPTLVS
ncbi:MAG: hypothetical protein AABX00_00615 [Nanoarchaeota archaeon]